ncbi:zinc-binding dehydrogenase [Natronocalculus amylovorans]|uniref:Zinc-binding dehydrogenase n=1 Tax=Natronocalculus amylovorans TaxID=2917812 RepID=A0AAE3FXI9_9EURY|nr:zinc-binding dehydrogenase [Natronocalculus amylovorans]MCL9817035.1 zinc-binding dehydrogenase [Natronocalculus amylovorans]NUE02936.1 oxidoreductase [Halorubraceae archaeon YAN]
MSKSRRALYFTAPRSAELREEEQPTPAAGEVLVETSVSAVSPGTELLIYRGDAPTDLPADLSIDSLDGSLSYPLQYGYAAVGVVTAVGEHVSSSWLGTQVFGFQPHQSHFVATPDVLRPVPDEIEPAVASLLPTMETAISLAHDGAPKIGEEVVVFGQGLVGLLLTTVLSSFPLSRLITVDPISARRSQSRQCGADVSIHPAELQDTIMLPKNADSELAGCDLCYELSGNPAALDSAVEVTGYDGRVIIGSWYGNKDVSLSLGGRFHRSRISLQASQVSTIDPALRGRWTADRRFDVVWEQLSTLDETSLELLSMPFDDAPKAYETLDRSPADAIGVRFHY